MEVRWRKARVEGEDGFSLAELQGSQFLVEDSVCIFFFWRL